MKFLGQLLVFLFIVANVNAQSKTEYLTAFCHDADMDCYYDMIQKNVNSYFRKEHEDWERDKFGLLCPHIEIQKRNSNYTLITHDVDLERNKIQIVTTQIVPMLALQFVGTDTFDINDNLCDYISIDSTIVFSAISVDKNNNINAVLHFFDGYFGYEEVKRHSLLYYRWFESCHKKYAKLKRNLPYMFKRINKLKPTQLLLIPSLSERFGVIPFIRDNNIYVYDILNDDYSELNSYIKQRCDIETIKALNEKPIPYIYTNSGYTITTTNQTPRDQINICE
ncbi:MAG: hypothetical protein E7069_13210 [Bacteroidales bacterium]|jgi:hypothetical protein|nr:hypothetical protein [Bacteroidales bacterium]